LIKRIQKRQNVFKGENYVKQIYLSIHIIVCLGIFQICSAERNRVIVRMGDNTLLDGFTVTGAADACILGENVDFSVENCTISDSDDSGIHAINGNVSIKWCDLKQNQRYAVRHEGEGCILK
jgi:hypothetical protein